MIVFEFMSEAFISPEAAKANHKLICSTNGLLITNLT